MIKIQKFTFNPFQENTYVIYDDTLECIIVDPGCYIASEEKELSDFISEFKLKPTGIINTHAHIDHVMGNKYVADKYNLPISMYESDSPMLKWAIRSSQVYGVPYNPSPEPSIILNEGDQVKFGNSYFDILFVPGHAPDHIVLINESQKIMIGGDVLFDGSIGRTDLPGGNHQELIQNIKTKIFPLDPSIVIYSGHGGETSIGKEKETNPFF